MPHIINGNVGDYDNVREINKANVALDRYVGENSNVRTDMCNIVIICKRERQQETKDVVRIYTDVASGDIGSTLEQYIP